VSRPTHTRKRSGGVVTAHHLTPAQSAARHASSTRRTCDHRVVCPYPALPRSQERHPLPRLLVPARRFLPPACLTVHLCHAAAPRAPTPATAGRATPRQPQAPPELGPPLRTVGHRSELTTSHRRHLLPSLWPHRRCWPPSSTLRTDRHDHQLRPSPRDLDVHFNASFDPFSGLPPMTIPRPSAPSWRLNSVSLPPPHRLKSIVHPAGNLPKPPPPPVSLSAGRISPVSHRRQGGGRSPPLFPRVGRNSRGSWAA
jgi:hypothetical protein